MYHILRYIYGVLCTVQYQICAGYEGEYIVFLGGCNDASRLKKSHHGGDTPTGALLLLLAYIAVVYQRLHIVLC